MLPLYQKDGFGISDLMILQAAIRSGEHDRQASDCKAAKLAGVALLEANH
ncbi:hypothetical protein OAI29_02870 [Amylibacter sp.]|nr:hypothetical protein [Amylibacter sp.]